MTLWQSLLTMLRHKSDMVHGMIAAIAMLVVTYASMAAAVWLNY